jgi:hypothetical protein
VRRPRGVDARTAAVDGGGVEAGPSRGQAPGEAAPHAIFLATEYGAPKTESADRWLELFPETVRLLRELQPLQVTPGQPVFTTTTGTPIEPKTFSAHWYGCLRALGIRQHGLYATKDTFVRTALEAGVKKRDCAVRAGCVLPESRLT